MMGERCVCRRFGPIRADDFELCTEGSRTTRLSSCEKPFQLWLAPLVPVPGRMVALFGHSLSASIRRVRPLIRRGLMRLPTHT
jgi:hypothetical protein